MTGSNRPLLGLGWPTVCVLSWWVHRRRALQIEPSNVPAGFLLGLAS